MSCLLCLELNDNAFDLNGAEGLRLNAKQILQQHFHLCFENDFQEGTVCRKCWWKVDIFHNFYLQIEYIHRSPGMLPQDGEYEKIFVQTLTQEFPEEDTITSSTCGVGIKAEDPVEEKPLVEPYRRTTVPGSSAGPKSKKIPKDVKVKTKSKESSSIVKVKSNTSSSNQCETCGERFLTLYKLKNHIKETHVKLEFKCSTQDCNESFVSKQMLVRHVKDKHTTVTCEHCQKEVRKSYLKKHVRSVHSLEDQTMCHLCGKVSNTKEAHNVHYITEHSDQNGVQCDICKTWYKNKLTIRMHFLYRHKQKPVICPICGKLSPNKKALTVHKRIHREDYKERFKCPICEKGFRDRTKLREHSYSHSGISDAYRCNHCEKTFRYGSDLSKHRKKAHPVEENLRKTSNYLGII